MSLLEELKEMRREAVSALEMQMAYVTAHQCNVDGWQFKIADLDTAIAALEPAPPEQAPALADPLSAELRSDPGSEENAGTNSDVPEGFTKWEGGERPVPVGATVDVLFNDGTSAEDSSAEIWDRVPLGQNYWDHKTHDRKIIAYRLKATMLEHDRSAQNPVEQNTAAGVWIHYMSATGTSGGNGWAHEIDWTQVDLYEVRPEGPPSFLSGPDTDASVSQTEEAHTGTPVGDDQGESRQPFPGEGEESRDQIEMPEGFTQWGGGECPIQAPHTLVQVIQRHGAEMSGSFYAVESKAISWAHDGGPYDIIAYRIISQPADQSEEDIRRIGEAEDAVDATLAGSIVDDPELQAAVSRAEATLAAAGGGAYVGLQDPELDDDWDAMKEREKADKPKLHFSIFGERGNRKLEEV